MDKLQRLLSNLTRLTLLYGKEGQEKARQLMKESFGFGTCEEYIQYVATQQECSVNEAKLIISMSPTAIQIMFILA